MSNDISFAEGFFSFKVRREDLGTLFIDIFGEIPDQSSPLFDSLTPHQKSKKDVSSEIKELASNKKAARTFAIMASPKLLIKNRLGGGTLEIDMTMAVQSPEVDEQAFAMVQMTNDNSFSFHLFDTPYHYLAWWLERNASKADQPSPNYIPPPVRFETILYLLHTIDMFRRSIYQGMVNNQAPEFSNIRMEDFLSSYSAAIEKKDMRWLTTTFLGLTPGLTPSVKDDYIDIMKAMTELDFLIPGESKDGHPPELFFGEAGISMGTEFHQSWFYSAGFEILLNEGAGNWGTLQRGYLAATGLANHLFLINSSDDDLLMVNHQAMTRDELDKKMINLLLDAMKAGPEDIEQTRIEPEPDTEQSQEKSEQASKMFCPICNIELNGKQKFCTTCGSKADSKADSAACPGCGVEITGNIKFCTRCGQKL